MVTEQEYSSQLQQLKADRDLAIQNRDKLRADAKRMEYPNMDQGTKDTIRATINASNEQNHAAERYTQIINRMESEGGVFKPSDIQEFVQEDIREMQQQEQIRERSRRGKPMYAVVRDTETGEWIRPSREIKQEEKELSYKITYEDIPAEKVAGVMARDYTKRQKETGTIYLKPSEYDPSKFLITDKPLTLEQKKIQEDVKFAEELLGVKDSGVIGLTISEKTKPQKIGIYEGITGKQFKETKVAERFISLKEIAKYSPVYEAIKTGWISEKKLDMGVTALTKGMIEPKGLSLLELSPKGKEYLAIEREMTSSVIKGMIPKTYGGLVIAGATFGVGFLAGKGVKALSMAPKVIRYGKKTLDIGLTSVYGVTTGLELSKAQTPEDVGKIIGRTGRDIALFGWGGKVGAMKYKKEISTSLKDLERATAQIKSSQFMGTKKTQIEAEIFKQTKKGGQYSVLVGEAEFGKAKLKSYSEIQDMLMKKFGKEQTGILIKDLSKESGKKFVIREFTIPKAAIETETQLFLHKKYPTIPSIRDVQRTIIGVKGIDIGGKKLFLSISKANIFPQEAKIKFGKMPFKKRKVSEGIQEISFGLTKEIARVTHPKLRERFFEGREFTPKELRIDIGKKMTKVSIEAQLSKSSIKATQLLKSASMKSIRFGLEKKTPLSKTFGEPSQKELKSLMLSQLDKQMQFQKPRTKYKAPPRIVPSSAMAGLLPKTKVSPPKTRISLISKGLTKQIEGLTELSGLRYKQTSISKTRQRQQSLQRNRQLEKLTEIQKVRSMQKISQISAITQISKISQLTKLTSSMKSSGSRIRTPYPFPRIRILPPHIKLPSFKFPTGELGYGKKKKKKGYREISMITPDFTAQTAGITTTLKKLKGLGIEKAIVIRGIPIK